MVKGRCMRCKSQQEMKDAKQVKMANGRDAIKGVCAKCGCPMFKIGKLPAPGAAGAGKK
jgi:Domain of unknown function (DUF5679)